MNKNRFCLVKKLIVFLFVAILCAVVSRYMYNEYFRIEAKVRTILEERVTDFKKFYNTEGYTDSQAYIAHGSGVGEFVYTNSYEGVLDSLQRGFKFIELDLLVTSDNIIIGGHDWSNFKRLIDYEEINDTPLTYEEIKNKKIMGKYSLLSSKEICSIMEEYPDFYLVTDKICDYSLLLEQIPYPDRLIVEVFSYTNCADALKAGIKYPALNIGLNGSRVKKLLKYKIPMLTGSSLWLFDDPKTMEYYKLLHENGVIIFLYHYTQKAVEPSFMKEYMGKVFSKFYVDRDYKEIIKENRQ